MTTRPYFAVLVILATAILTGSFTNAQEATESDSRTQLDELLTKRRAVLLQRVDLLEQKLSQGLVKVDSVVIAREQLLGAEIQLVTTKQQRLEILEKRIENMRKLEESVKMRYQAGETTLESLLSTTAARLHAEIDFVKERGGDDPLEKLQGVWILESMEMAGIKLEGDELPERFRGMQHSIKGSRMITSRIDGKTYECALTLNGATEPKQLDMVLTEAGNKPKTAKCIYKIVGGMLIIAEGKETRPTSFETDPKIPSKISTFTRKQ